MKVFQYLLIIASIGFVVLYFARFRTKFVDRLIILIFGATAFVLAIVPDLSTHIANVLGVGRGTDLLLYLSIILFAGIHSITQGKNTVNKPCDKIILMTEYSIKL